jgi:hypothetical protein
MAMRRIFWGFCRNWFLIDPLHYLSDSLTHRIRESAFESLQENSASQREAMVSRGVAIQIF